MLVIIASRQEVAGLICLFFWVAVFVNFEEERCMSFTTRESKYPKFISVSRNIFKPIHKRGAKPHVLLLSS